MLSITVTVSPGCTVEGVLLALNQDRMRIALQGSEDTIELKRRDDRWTTEEEVAVELEALFTDGCVDWSSLLGTTPRVAAAGRA